jgi:hypothetical protein
MSSTDADIAPPPVPPNQGNGADAHVQPSFYAGLGPGPCPDGCVSIQFSTQPGPKKKAFVGFCNSSLEVLAWIRSLPDRYFGVASSCSQEGFTDLIRIFVPDPINPVIQLSDGKTQPNDIPLFELRFNPTFSKIKIWWATKGKVWAIADQYTYPRYAFGRTYNQAFDYQLRPAPSQNPQHPWNVLQDVLEKMTQKHPGGVNPSVNMWVRPQLMSRMMANRQQMHNQLHFLQVLCELARGSIRCYACNERHGDKMEQVNGLWLHGITVVFPWAVTLLEQHPECAMTDSTFRACKPYTLAILHLIFANESVPIGFALSPSETADSYVKLYDHINAEIGVVNRGVPPENICFESTGQEPWEEDPVEEVEIAEEEEIWTESSESQTPVQSPEPPVPTLRREPPPRVRTLLTQLPIVTDQGTALQAFVAHFQLDWKLCHRHIIESVGAKGRITDFVVRILNCFSLQEYNATRSTILDELDGRRDSFKAMNGYNSLLRLLGENPLGDKTDLHPLAVLQHWALWERLGCPRTTNSAEAVNGRLNAENLRGECFVAFFHILVRYHLLLLNSIPRTVRL